MVDAEDLNFLALNWQFGVNAPNIVSFETAWAEALAGVNIVIPEPAAGGVLALGVLGLAVRRRRW